jgi:Ras-related protein Rab-6A
VNTARWVEEVRAERGADVVVVLVGNKTDLVERRRARHTAGQRERRSPACVR